MVAPIPAFTQLTGYIAEATGGGQDGLQRLQIAPFDLVMTDLGAYVGKACPYDRHAIYSNRASVPLDPHSAIINIVVGASARCRLSWLDRPHT